MSRPIELRALQSACGPFGPPVSCWAEKLDSKLLVHNYGHGGGGMTLSWGTSDLAMEIAFSRGRGNTPCSERAVSVWRLHDCCNAGYAGHDLCEVAST